MTVHERLCHRICHRVIGVHRSFSLQPLSITLHECDKAIRGRLLATDVQVMVLEDECSQDNEVVLSFSNDAVFRAWSNSREYHEYQERLAHHKMGTNAVVLLMQSELALDELMTISSLQRNLP